MRFEFEKAQSQIWIVEGVFDDLFYYHCNFTAKQAHSSVFTFFAEVTPEDGDDCDVICCKLLNDDDNGIIKSSKGSKYSSILMQVRKLM
jgi:hypothetical protein